jgi:prepilin-type processing-associated H-X9-DG protein
VEDFAGTILLGPFPNQSGFLGRASNHTLLSASRKHHPTSNQGLWQKFQMTGLHEDLNNYLFLDGHVEQLHYTWTTDPDKVDSFGNSGGMWST